MLHITYKDILMYSLKLASKFPMFGFSMLNSRTLSSKCTLMRVVCQTNVFPNFMTKQRDFPMRKWRDMYNQLS